MAINLIPQIQKDWLKSELTKNKVWSVLVFLTVGLGFFLLTLVCLNFFISNRVKSLSGLIEAKQSFMSGKEFQDMKSRIARTNKDLDFARKVWQEQVFLGKLMEKINLLSPNSISYNRATLLKKTRNLSNNSEEKKIQFLIEADFSGVSETREDLYGFRKKLLQENIFENPFFAPLSWKEPKNGPFSLHFNYISNQ